MSARIGAENTAGSPTVETDAPEDECTVTVGLVDIIER
jgi:hypothetical protein